MLGRTGWSTPFMHVGRDRLVQIEAGMPTAWQLHSNDGTIVTHMVNHEKP